MKKKKDLEIDWCIEQARKYKHAYDTGLYKTDNNFCVDLYGTGLFDLMIEEILIREEEKKKNVVHKKAVGKNRSSVK